MHGTGHASCSSLEPSQSLSIPSQRSGAAVQGLDGGAPSARGPDVPPSAGSPSSSAELLPATDSSPPFAPPPLPPGAAVAPPSVVGFGPGLIAAAPPLGSMARFGRTLSVVVKASNSSSSPWALHAACTPKQTSAGRQRSTRKAWEEPGLMRRQGIAPSIGICPMDVESFFSFNSASALSGHHTTSGSEWLVAVVV
jgi:hypothetical protein